MAAGALQRTSVAVGECAHGRANACSGLSLSQDGTSIRALLVGAIKNEELVLRDSHSPVASSGALMEWAVDQLREFDRETAGVSWLLAGL